MTSLEDILTRARSEIAEASSLALLDQGPGGSHAR